MPPLPEMGGAIRPNTASLTHAIVSADTFWLLVLSLKADEVPVGVGDDELVDVEVGAAGPVRLRFERDDEDCFR